MSLNDEVKKFVRDVSVSIPVVDGQFCVHVRTGDVLKEVYFSTAREAASFMAGIVSVSADPAMMAYV